jgi:hypothetical protein
MAAAMAGKQRLWTAMGAYAVLGVLAWFTLTERIPSSGIEMRWLMITLLAILAVATWARRRHDAQSTERDAQD